jgi:hypothetical protein
MITEISWRPTEETEIHNVRSKGLSRRKKEEVEKKDKNEKWGGLCRVDLFYFR